MQMIYRLHHKAPTKKMNYELIVISMQTLNYIFLLFSIIFLYWCAVIAYDKSVKIIPLGELPLFTKQSCAVKHIEIKHEDSSLHDLSIYYSGIKKFEIPVEENITNSEKTKDKGIQEEILKIVKSKQQVIEKKPQQNIQKIENISEKNLKKAPEPVKKKQIQIPQVDDDAFTKKSSKKSINKKSGSIFDVIE